MNTPFRCHDAEACALGQKQCPMPTACGLHQIQELAPVQETHATAPIPDERAAFEAWTFESAIRADLGAWEAWQARAALAATPAEATESVLIDGVAYTIPEPVAHELLRLHIELQQAPVPVVLPEPDFQLKWSASAGRYSFSKPITGDADCYTADTVRALLAGVSAPAAPDENGAHRELYFAAYALCDGICEDHPAIDDVIDAGSHGRLCNALAQLDSHYGVTSPEERISKDHRAAISHPTDGVHVNAVASIYVTAGGDREFGDWRVPLPVGSNLLYTVPQAQADARDAQDVRATVEKLPRYTYGYKGDDWGMNQSLRSYESPDGAFLRRDEVLAAIAAQAAQQVGDKQ